MLPILIANFVGVPIFSQFNLGSSGILYVPNTHFSYFKIKENDITQFNFLDSQDT